MEKEQKRLEVIKRRQERELAQLLQYEVTRQELQANRVTSVSPATLIALSRG